MYYYFYHSLGCFCKEHFEMCAVYIDFFLQCALQLNSVAIKERNFQKLVNLFKLNVY